MEGEGTSSRADWELPAEARPPLVSELVERIDLALATARASEAAVMTVGAAALDAAEQAKRAAELAERASSLAAARSSTPRRPPREDPALDRFSAHADRVVDRLRRLQRLPLSA